MGTTVSKTHESCSICIDEITQRDAKSILECGHKYHLRCLGKWLERGNTCPLCRAPTEVDKDTVTLRVSWEKRIDGSWIRNVTVVSSPYVWHSGPKPVALEIWIRNH
jgi:hypothetical protein